MRVLYGGQIYSMHMQAVGGINRYLTNLISRLPDYVNPRAGVGTPRTG